LELTVLPSYDTTIFDTICLGYPYTNTTYPFLNTDPTAPGLLSVDTTLQTLPTGSYSCDSIVRLELTVLPSYDITIFDTICFGIPYENTTYLFLDTTPTAPGLLTIDTTLQTLPTGSYSCDSIVRLELMVLPSYDTTIFDTICLGDPYTNMTYTFLNTTPTAPGLLSVDTTLQTKMVGSNFCDSIVRLELTVLPSYDITIFDTICFGEPYENETYLFLDTTPTAPGLLSVDTTLQTLPTGSYSCDSIVRLRLTVLPSYDITIFDTICLGDPYENSTYTFLNTTPTVPGLLSIDTTLQTLPTGTYSCDSIVKLRLMVLLPYDTLITDVICFGDSYTKHGFNIHETQLGLNRYSQNLKRENGCDSIIILHLTVNPTYDIIINASICVGDNYNANGFDISVSEPGFYIYPRNLKTINGCDSIVTLQLTVNPVYYEYISGRIYEDEFYKIGSYQYNTPGLHVSNLQTVNGCDSIITLNLDVIYYPAETAFSPFNKDGINDYFMPGFKVQIFNRYGALVYETRTPEEQALGWDGRNSKGKNVEPGIYFYILYNSSNKPRLKSSVEVLKR
jgi:hypothetical protein